MKPYLPLLILTPSSAVVNAGLLSPLFPSLSNYADSSLRRALVEGADSSYSSDTIFRRDATNATNTARIQYGANPVGWDFRIAEKAEDWAKECKFDHSGDKSYGENLAKAYPNVTSAIRSWADEGSEYNYKKAGFDEDTGHFTQLVWKNMTAFGCGRANCTDTKDIGGWMLVCKYTPPGNNGSKTEFSANVGKPAVGMGWKLGGEPYETMVKVGVGLAVTMFVLLCL